MHEITKQLDSILYEISNIRALILVISDLTLAGHNVYDELEYYERKLKELDIEVGMLRSLQEIFYNIA